MSRSRIAWVALPAALAMTLSACNSGGGGGTTSQGKENPDGTVSIYGTEPKSTLFPANTTEAGGGKVTDALFTRLVGYKPEDGAPYNLLAESIKTSDAKVYDIKLKQGWKFHDGTEVKAKNFVDAWNFAALLAERAAGRVVLLARSRASTTFTRPTRTPSRPPRRCPASRLVDDTEFKVTLSAPELGLPDDARLPRRSRRCRRVLRGPEGRTRPSRSATARSSSSPARRTR